MISVNFHAPLNETVLLNQIVPAISELECTYSSTLANFSNEEFIKKRNEIADFPHQIFENITEYVENSFGKIFGMPSKEELAEQVNNINKARHSFFRHGFRVKRDKRG